MGLPLSSPPSYYYRLLPWGWCLQAGSKRDSTPSWVREVLPGNVVRESWLQGLVSSWSPGWGLGETASVWHGLSRCWVVILKPLLLLDVALVPAAIVSLELASKVKCADPPGGHRELSGFQFHPSRLRAHGCVALRVALTAPASRKSIHQ